MSIKIALAGNPNSGKTTMFNNLTGNRQYVGNWPGVTVEKKEGQLKGADDVIIQDLPGIYSLSPYTLEEVVTRNYLINEHPDVILNIVDGSNIERNLYLTTQLMELGLPVVIALNMIDVVRKNGDSINLKKLGQALGCEVIETSALRGEGSREAALRAAQLAKANQKQEHPHVFSGTVEHALAHIEEAISGKVEKDHHRWYTIKLFERDEKVKEQLKLDAATLNRIEQTIASCEEELDDDAESIITNERYTYISKLVQSCVTKSRKKGDLSTSDKIDRVVTNRILGLPIFAVVMFIVYYISVTTVGDIVTGFTNDTLFGEWIQGGLGGWLEGINTAPWLTGLIVDGIVGGVGAVLGFVPQMLILFFLLALLEDCGYMARIAFVMDRLFRRFGLSGKSFIPMLIGTGCGVPGIMASRTIENERDRRMTIITTTFIPCGAKMPIVALIAGAVFGGAWWVAPSAYFIGMAAIVISGLILKKTKRFAGDAAPFVMELPAYHWPSASNVLRSTWERGWSFIKRAGTIILLSSIVIWFLSNFGMTDGTFGMVEDMNTSILASIGNVIAPVFAPLGFGTWQSSVATFMGLVAKEGVVSAFGVLFGVAGEAMELVEDGAFGELTTIASHFTALGGFSFLIFNLLCAPCFAAIGAIRREMNNAGWTWFAIAYQCGFAYAISLIVYQLGMLFTAGQLGVGTVCALLVLAALLYLLFRKPPKGVSSNQSAVRATM
ncbi:ferrous iron transport protein B [Eubacteriales bacterium OttesenSCG-928-N13]|nr:ferrous iron transport protein B [Eubacteriales bacterium OttesenSCG-928-N13]